MNNDTCTFNLLLVAFLSSFSLGLMVTFVPFSLSYTKYMYVTSPSEQKYPAPVQKQMDKNSHTLNVIANSIRR